MNQRSSRSHAICRLVIESRSPLQPGSVRVSSLHLVDLGVLPSICSYECSERLCVVAGSERVGHTGAEGSTLVEGININKSLLTLGMVIHKLSDIPTADPKPGCAPVKHHVPFRNSKLTRILQPCLGMLMQRVDSVG